MGMLDREQIASYICVEYRKKIGKSITPIKLQKSLYFLFAFWGGKIRQAKKCESLGDSYQIEDDTIKNYDENLFNANFEAWTYGPVDKEIHIKYKNEQLFDINFEDYNKITDDLVKNFINTMLARIFKTNDFVLVDLSRQDKAWSEAYGLEGNYKPICNETIIEEYSNI